MAEFNDRRLVFRKDQAKGREAQRYRVHVGEEYIGLVMHTPDSSKTGGLWSYRYRGANKVGYGSRTDAASALHDRHKDRRGY